MRRFSGVLLGIFAIGMMQLILAAALPDIVLEIGGSKLYSWVSSSYMLASLITIPIFSKLADAYGKKRFYIIGMSVFALGTLYGGLSKSMAHLISARVIQGLSAGIITPVSLALIADMFPSEKRGRMIGVFGLVQLLSNLLSSPVGGFITKQLGWHWIFFVTLIMIVLALLLVSIGDKEKDAVSSMSFSNLDLTGALVFGTFCVLTVAFSSAISKQREFGGTGILFLLGMTVTAIILIFNEIKHENPIIKLAFFKTKIIRRSIISSVVAGAIMYGLITILPLYGAMLDKQGFQINENQILFRFMIGITVGMLISSRFIGKLNSKGLTKVLWIAMSTCSFFMLYSILIANILIFNMLNVIIGLCTGAVMATFLINSQNSVSSEERTVLSGLIQLGRYLGASIGITILTGMLPEVNSINTVTQFIGVFALLIALCLAGLINEVI